MAAKVTMDKAGVALQLAQSEYDKISWQSGIGATQQAMALGQASTDYESARANPLFSPELLAYTPSLHR